MIEGRVYINIRFGKYHLQVHREPFSVTFFKNSFWDFQPYGSKYFKVYCWLGKNCL